MNIDAKEVERRLRRLGQMRVFFVEMRRAAQAAHKRGEWSYPPPYDIRGDREYWVRRAEEISNSE